MSTRVGVITFPGIFVVLAPVAMLSGKLGLSESFGPYMLARPTAALLFQPVELVLTFPAVFAVDALARRLGCSRSRRWVLTFGAAVAAFSVAGVWGHAEDVLATGLALYAVDSLLAGKTRRMGWLMGAAVVTQPLVGLAVPLLFAVSPAGSRVRFAVRSVVPSVVLLGLALLGNWADASRALVEQPTPPSINHATPWIALAPKVPQPSLPPVIVDRRAGFVHGHFRVVTSTIHTHKQVLVSGGPPRTLGLLLAIAIGVWAWRNRSRISPTGLVWLTAVAFSLRCAFEPVMTPYYLVPPVLVAMVSLARVGPVRQIAGTVLAIGDGVFAYYHFSPWVWWPPVVAMLAGVLALGYPGAAAFAGTDRRGQVGTPSTVTTVGGGADGLDGLEGSPGAAEPAALDPSERPDGVLAAREPLAP